MASVMEGPLDWQKGSMQWGWQLHQNVHAAVALWRPWGTF